MPVPQPFLAPVTEGAVAREAARLFPRYFDWAGACVYLTISRRGLTRLVQRGLPAIRLGRGLRGALRFDRLRLDVWLAEQSVSVHTSTVDPRSA